MSSNPPDRQRLDSDFVARLFWLDGWRNRDGQLQQDIRLRDAAALGALKRAAGKAPDGAGPAHAVLAPYLLPEDFDADAWPVTVLYTVGGLFALYPSRLRGDPAHPPNRWERSFGASFRLKAPPGSSARVAVERRFQWLLAADRAELPVRLRQCVSLLHSPSPGQPVNIDWAQLLYDLRRWGLPGAYIQSSWAAAFWREDQAAQQRN